MASQTVPMAADPRIDRWLAQERPWLAEMRALRALLLAEGLGERLRWRKPCYFVPDHGNIAIIAPMKDAVGLSFFKGVLLDDPTGLLVPVGPNSRSAMWAKFGRVEEIAVAENALGALVRQAADHERQGRRPEMPSDDYDLPEEIAEALAADEDLALAWDDLTPGRRRSWVIHVSGAKQSATRARRFDKARGAVLAGRGLHDR